jgi:hypothetical protein
MARIPRTHNARSIRIWPGMGNDDTPGGAAITTAATTYSNPVSMPGMGGLASVHLIWVGAAGSLVGTFTLQGSLVQDPDLANDNDWVTIASPLLSGTSLTVSSNDGNAIVALPYGYLPEWIRVKFAFTSGTGSVRAFSRVSSDR